MVKVICVSGCVCCGKTKYSKKLAKEKNYEYIDLNKVIDDNKLKDKYDKKRKTWEVDVSKLKKVKKRLEKRGYNKLKIRENLDAEIFDVCYEEAKELGHKVEVIES